jgi:hypothetical protein
MQMLVFWVMQMGMLLIGQTNISSSSIFEMWVLDVGYADRDSSDWSNHYQQQFYIGDVGYADGECFWFLKGLCRWKCF